MDRAVLAVGPVQKRKHRVNMCEVLNTTAVAHDAKLDLSLPESRLLKDDFVTRIGHVRGEPVRDLPLLRISRDLDKAAIARNADGHNVKTRAVNLAQNTAGGHA